MSLLRATILFLATAAPPYLVAQQVQTQRVLRPEDLFRVRQVGQVEWSADGLRAAIELTRPDHTLGSEVSNEIALLDVKRRTLRTVSSSAASYVGFFNAKWSPDGQRLAFLSVDASASVQAWIWKVGADTAAPLNDLDVRVGFDDPPMAWVDNDRIAVIDRDFGSEKSGNLYFEILRGRNVADQWRRARDAQTPSVSVLESGIYSQPLGPSARLVVVNVRTRTSKELVRGRIHNLKVYPDGRLITFIQERPGIPGQSVSSYFDLATTDVDKAYVAVNRGTEFHVIDACSGMEVRPSEVPSEKAEPELKADPKMRLPRPDALWISSAPAGGTSLYTANAQDGSHFWMCSQNGTSNSSCTEIWKANDWVREIKTGAIESIPYASQDGTPLTAWLLLPPDYAVGIKLPLVTIIYPGSMYDSQQPTDFSLFEASFWEHPQLFAALGYAVLLPSMPPAKNQSDELKLLSNGVIPAIDAVVARGIADSDRVAVVGQSNGGFATLGLIAQTNRFRSAIASAGFCDLVSLYGTFYGQYRYGDAGPPEKGQVLRMLQMEKGALGLGGPPWVDSDPYWTGSPILSAGKVQTPLMLVHGDLDFIPIQQDEEFFSALYRQDKRATFLRYQGEWHTISNRVNVLDLWKRVTAWLAETMPPRK